MTHFDGKGNLTQVDSLLINGSPISDWSAVSGTEVHTVVWPPFDGPDRNVTSVGIKVD